MDNEAKNKLIRLGLIATLTLGCGGGAAAVAVGSGEQPIQDTTSLPANDMDARSTAIVGTAMAVQDGGPNYFNEIGYPQEVLDAQKGLLTTYTVTATVDGNTVTENIGFQMDSTLVGFGGTGYGNFLGIDTTGHGFSRTFMDAKFAAYFSGKYFSQNVTINNAIIAGINIDGELSLGPNDFGLDYQFTDSADFAFLMIRKDVIARIDPEKLVKLEQDAMPVDRISFNAPDANTQGFGMCHPGESSLRPVVTMNADYVGSMGNFAAFSPYLISEGCSGSFFGATDPVRGWVKIGITVNDRRFEEGNNTNAYVFTYSALGKPGYYSHIENAASGADASLK